jgi:hypothetical protein
MTKTSAKAIRYRKKYPEKFREIQRRYRLNHPKKYKYHYHKYNGKYKDRMKQYRESTFEFFVRAGLSVLKRYDLKHDREYNIDLPYLLELLKLQNYKCAVTGISLTHQNGDLRAISIDRIDSSKGHIKGNIQLVCQFYNMGKGNKSDFEARGIIQEIRNSQWNSKQADLATGT